jgi:hypoxanthine phosphoribosyltransferase
MWLSEEPLIRPEAIQKRVREIAEAVSRDYQGRELTLVVVLKGGTLFAADLMRALSIPVTIEYVRARSYDGNRSKGRVELTVLPERSLVGKEVLIVEDVLDTGRTTSAILAAIRAQAPASVRLCVLLDKPKGHSSEIAADYVGFTIDNCFVVGYGLDHNERYRQLPAIYVLTP